MGAPSMLKVGLVSNKLLKLPEKPEANPVNAEKSLICTSFLFSFFCAIVVDATVLSSNKHVKNLFYHKYGHLTTKLWFISVMTVTV